MSEERRNHRSGEPSFGVMKENLQRNADAQHMVVGCLRCPKWKFTGPAKAAREAQEVHRKVNHPDTFSGTRRKRRPWGHANMTVEREEEIRAERRRRMRELGIPDNGADDDG